MFLKITGMITVFLVCSVWGIFRTMRLSKRVRQLEKWIGAVRFISSEIRYFAEPLDVIINKLASSSEYRELQFFDFCRDYLMRTRNFAGAWKQAVSGAKERLALSAADYEPLQWLGGTLGKTDVEGQVADCERCVEMLGVRLSSAREDKSRRGKMYTSLGILTGVFFVVLFI